MYAVWKQSQFEFIRTIRNRQFLVFSIAMPILFYFIFIQVNGPNLQLEGTTWKTYFLMSMAAFSIVGSSLFGLASRISFERTRGWLRLVRTTPMRHTAYIFGQCLSQFVVSVASVTALFVVGGLSQGIDLSAAQWLESGLWLAVGSIPFVTMGLFIGTLFRFEAANLVCNIVNFALGVLGGLWFPVAIMPQLMQDIAHWTPTYHFARLAWQTVAGAAVSLPDVLILLAYAALFVLLTLWVMRKQEEHDS
jgi:ABC-2 type transport system permease protein